MKRKEQRLSTHNYSDPKKYFVTINVISKELPLGIIFNEKVYLNCIGKIVEKCWKDIPNHYKECELHEYVIMPDHIHGIIRINSERGVGNRH
ncbi:MAG: transposase, partial [Candidatus Marinimicrobia bacterium]|nr:transposase [Candidatus Neomarinimicrobiota bacterium]